jgi:phosphoribosylanthranilate isomerase
MSYQPAFKFGDVTNLGDARFAAGVGAQFIGFAFASDHPFFINPLKAHEIIQWLSGPCYIAEYRELDMEQLTTVKELIAIDYVLFPFRARPDELYPLPVEYIVELQPGEEPLVFDWLEEAHPQPVYLQYSDRSEGAVENLLADSVRVERLHQLNERVPLILNLPFVKADVREAVERLTPYAIALQSSQEEKVGYNDFSQLIELVEQFQEI